MKRFFTLIKNELKLNIRDMNMVIFALIMPLAVFIVPGLIYRSKPASEGAEYTFLEQFFGAVCAVSICAGGLMGLPLVVLQYRVRGLCQRFCCTDFFPYQCRSAFSSDVQRPDLSAALFPSLPRSSQKHQLLNTCRVLLLSDFDRNCVRI